MGCRPLGLGGELAVNSDLCQGSFAPSSMANSQQESSAQQKISILSHTQKTSTRKFKKITIHNKKKNKKLKTAKNNKTNTNNTTATQTTTASTITLDTQQTQQSHTQTRITITKQNKKKGRAQNKTNSKQRKRNDTPALEGLPSGDPGQPRRFAFCGDQMTQAVSRKRPRNTKRGIRSAQKIEERKIKRSFKRREARRRNRKKRHANKSEKKKKENSASAQEPLKRIKIELGKEIHIATINNRGTNKVWKREEVEDWMKSKNISILALQETKSQHSKRENRKD